MRQRLVLGAVLSSFVAAIAGIALGACGGSSSETPPPLQPDPQGFRYAGVPVSATAADSDAGALPALDQPEQEKPGKPARSTWGSAKPGR